MTTTTRYLDLLHVLTSRLSAAERARVLAPVHAARDRYEANPTRAARGCYHVAVRFAIGEARAACEGGCFT